MLHLATSRFWQQFNVIVFLKDILGAHFCRYCTVKVKEADRKWEERHARKVDSWSGIKVVILHVLVSIGLTRRSVISLISQINSLIWICSDNETKWNAASGWTVWQWALLRLHVCDQLPEWLHNEGQRDMRATVWEHRVQGVCTRREV